jgi:ABC-type dipeptide/oligopeptide/nickel transport system permease subunit
LFLLKPLPRVKTETQKDHSRRSKTMKPITVPLTRSLLTAFCLLLITVFSCFHPAIARAVTTTSAAAPKTAVVEPVSPPSAADNLQKLQETNACVGCDFKGISLKDLNLSSANLEGANLSQADLERTNLQGANLKGTDLRGADLGKTLLAGADLSGANLLGADLEKANLQGANLTNANLQKADLEKANLTHARLDGANLQDADGEGMIGVDPNQFNS